MNMPANAVNWFEIPVKDFDRAKKFYSAIYNYEMPEYPMKNRMGILPYNNQQGIGGAIVQGEGYEPAKTGAKLFLQAGTDLTEVLNRIEPAGGKVVMPKTQVTEEIGYIAGFEDTEGNLLYLHSPK